MASITALSGMLKAAFIVILAGQLLACGSDSDSSPPPPPPPAASTPQINDLTVSADNELRSITQLRIDVSELINANKRAYLSICSDPGEINNSAAISMQYNNCLLRSPLDPGRTDFTLTLPNHIGNLIAIVWYFDTAQPRIFRWQRASADNDVWLLHEE